MLTLSPRGFMPPRLLRRAHTSALNRPSPPSLPPEQQREFQLLQRAVAQSSAGVHPDAQKPLEPDFEGDINPRTGEQGGPKTEPVGKWAEGDWSFKGRVSDF